MVDPEDKARLERLDQRIKARKAANAPRPKIEEHHTQAQLAWRMVIELVAGLAIGFGIGWGLDRLFGTLPLFLVIFTLLGFVAGVRTMLRSAREMQAENAVQDDETGPRDDDTGSDTDGDAAGGDDGRRR